MTDEITERCSAEGHPQYKSDGRCYCGARDYPEDQAELTETSAQSTPAKTPISPPLEEAND